jgi:hypothetical protein
MMSWRKNINKGLKWHLEQLIRESFLYRNQYNKADDTGKAQLWVALAILAKRISEAESKIKLHEGVLKEISPKGAMKQKPDDKVREEVDNIFKAIIQGKPIAQTKAKEPVKKIVKIKRKKK